MSGFTYLIRTKVTGDGSLASLAKSAAAADKGIAGIGRSAMQSGSAVARMGSEGRRAVDGMRSGFVGLAAQIGVVATAASSLSTVADMDSFNRSITFAGGKDGAANLSSVNRMVADLKLPLKESLEGFKTLSGGLMGTGVTAQQTQDIFRSMGEGAVVMGLSADETKGALLALSQMASKGTVNSEELRGQLGERLPGAFDIAARAMGVNTKTLGKMLDQGKVVSKDFLPKFAAEMHKTFGPGVASALTGARANFNEMGNSILKLKEVIGTQLMPAATALINNVLIPGANFIGENIKAFGFLATSVAGVYAAVKIYNVTAAISTVLTGGLTGAVGLLSEALRANHIGFVVGALVALGSGVVYAWHKFEGFRGFVMGMFSLLKEFGSIMYDNMIAPFVSMGKVLAGVFTRDPKLITEGVQDGMNLAKKVLDGPSPFSRLKNAFSSGYSGAVTNLAAQNDPRSAYEDERDDRRPTYKGALQKAFADNSTQGGSDAENARQAREISRGISDGGVRNITIHIGEMGNGLTVHTTNVRDGGQQVHDHMLKVLTQVINSANQMQ
jgi:tape measure domain-containing protein